MANQTYRPDSYPRRILDALRHLRCECGKTAIPDRAYMGRYVCRRCGHLMAQGTVKGPKVA